MLAHCHGRWANIVQTLNKCIVSAVITDPHQILTDTFKDIKYYILHCEQRSYVIVTLFPGVYDTN